MVGLPGGSFQMGSSPEEIAWATALGTKQILRDEQRAHQVEVPRFSISITEITRDQFDAFMRATRYGGGGPCADAHGRLFGSTDGDWRAPGFEQDGNHPIVCVSWDDATAYARWLSKTTGKAYRLPREDEWEYAARAGSTAGRHWGWNNADACRYANVNDTTAGAALQRSAKTVFPCTDGYVYTAPVGRFQSNGFGLYDMMGNVWEWTDGCPDSDAGPPAFKPALASGACLRIIRGGSWYDAPWAIRSATRLAGPGDTRSRNMGFRVVRTD